MAKFVRVDRETRSVHYRECREIKDKVLSRAIKWNAFCISHQLIRMLQRMQESYRSVWLI